MRALLRDSEENPWRIVALHRGLTNNCGDLLEKEKGLEVVSSLGIAALQQTADSKARATIRAQVRSIPELKFEDQQMTSYGGFVV